MSESAYPVVDEGEPQPEHPTVPPGEEPHPEHPVTEPGEEPHPEHPTVPPGEEPHPEHPVAPPDEEPHPEHPTQEPDTAQPQPHAQAAEAPVESLMGLRDFLAVAPRRRSAAVTQAAYAALERCMRLQGHDSNGHYTMAQWQEYYEEAMNYTGSAVAR